MIAVALRIALRELTGSLKEFWLFLACLALGTAAIAAAGSVTEVFTRGLDRESRMLLGGDAQFIASQRRAFDDERAFLQRFGRLAETVELDVMGEANGIRKEVDVRAVDAAFPLLGEAHLSAGEPDLQQALARQKGDWGAAVSQSFLDGFDVDIGDTVAIGPVRAIIRSRIDKLPDRLGTFGSFGPEALVHIDSLDEAQRLTAGQLFRSSLLLDLRPGVDFASLKSRFEARFGDAALRVQAPDEAVDGLQNLLSLLNSFLAVIGIAALVAGGIGVAQATSSFLETRRESIAALKALGAESATIRNAYLFQLGALSVMGSCLGVILGGAAPYLLAAIAGARIPLPQALALYPAPLIKAAILGLLTAAIFALPAIGRARATQPSRLFRAQSETQRTPVPRPERVWATISAVLLAAVATLTSQRPLLTMLLLMGAIGAWALFLAAAFAVRLAATRGAQKARGLWRLALSNIGGPGSLATSIVPALGLGLTLLTLVVSVQSNLLRQISETAPAGAPSLIFTQIPGDKVDRFDQILRQAGIDTQDTDQFRRAPFVLARLVALNGEPVVEQDVAESERWVVSAETRLTYLNQPPPETALTKGAWWPPDYSGPLLASVEADVARGLGVDVGDDLGFRVFGREVSARVASLRVVEWGTFGIGSNTAFILSPGVLEAARPYHVAIAKTDPARETAIINALGTALPGVVVFQTRPALETAARLFGQIAVAVNAAAGVVTVAGLLVLAGTFAVMARKRRTEAALLKTFGATRFQVLGLYAGEFAIAGGAASLLGVILGIGAAYPIVLGVFEAQWTMPVGAAGTVLGAAVLVLALGGLGVGAATLARSPAAVLRSP